jgi:hypothetical protein
MERGTDVMRLRLSEATTKMEIRQSRLAWLADCKAKNEFKYSIGGNQIAHSLEESSCAARLCWTSCYHWTMQVKDIETDAEIVTVDRPCSCGCCGCGTCKCCCYQTATFASGGQSLGKVKETFYCCVPSYKMYDDQGRHLYTIQPPTCWGGACADCFTGRGEWACASKKYCRAPCYIFAPDQADTSGDAPVLGKILKKPNPLTGKLAEGTAFDVNFPADATASQKAMLVGASLFFNSLWFEWQHEG